MKKSVRGLSCVMSIVFLLILLPSAVSADGSSTVVQQYARTNEELQFSNQIVEDLDFSEDCIIVLLEHEYGVVNAQIGKDFFLKFRAK